MGFPKITELVTCINKKLTGNDWNSNLQKIVNWLSLGDTDIKVKSVEADTIKSNGNNIINNGNITATSVTANTITSNNFVGNGEHLENIKVSNVFAFTPFAINSAKADFIDITDTSKLVFLVDNGTLYKPLKITTADGKNITITSINEYDVSGLNGTYYIFADEQTNGGSVYLKACEIYRQNETPVGNNGDVWLDVSCEPYVAREKVSSNWFTDLYNKVPLAKVVISSGTITSLEMMNFNDNGVDVKVVESYRNGTDWYRVWSNGLIEQGGYEENVSTSGKTITFLKEFSSIPQVMATNNEYNNRTISASDISTTSFLLRFKSGGDNAVQGTGCWYAFGK